MFKDLFFIIYDSSMEFFQVLKRVIEICTSKAVPGKRKKMNFENINESLYWLS